MNTQDESDHATCPMCGRESDVIECPMKKCRVVLYWDHRTPWEEAKASGDRWLAHHVRTLHAGKEVSHA